MGLLDYFTKEGREKIAQRQEQKRMRREEEDRLKNVKNLNVHRKTCQDMPKHIDGLRIIHKDIMIVQKVEDLM